jgi:hypothetical protein
LVLVTLFFAFSVVSASGKESKGALVGTAIGDLQERQETP